MDDEPILWLDEIEPSERTPAAGSKMTRLAELARAGLAVPPGFAVTTSAYRAFAESAGLDEAVERDLAAVGDASLAEVTAASARLRAAVEAAPLPPTLAEQIAGAYEELSFRSRQLGLPTAVRSSALREDAADASCAGQFDSYLGVSGRDGVVAAVRACWGSLFTPRAILYRHKHGLSHAEFPMAVGVLELIDARSSGVGFSIHPVTGKRDRLVVEASWGWGEAVVQGLVRPDHIELDKADRRILRHDVADKVIASLFDHSVGRVVEAEMPSRFRRVPALDDEEIGAVADAVLRIEELYGHPVDVEWVISRHRQAGEPVTVVQARPETIHSGGATEAETEACPVWDPAAYAARYAFGPSR